MFINEYKGQHREVHVEVKLNTESVVKLLLGLFLVAWNQFPAQLYDFIEQEPINNHLIDSMFSFPESEHSGGGGSMCVLMHF